MTEHRATAVVIVTRHGREAIPTIRSLRRAGEEYGSVRILVAVSEPHGDVVLSWLRSTGATDVEVMSGPTVTEAALSALAATDTAYVTVIEAGDLVSSNWWIDGAGVAPPGEADVLHPELLLTFGRRSGAWTQSARPTPDRRELVRTDPWGSTASVRTALLQSWLAEADQSATLASGLATFLALKSARVRHARLDGTVAFSRVWDSRAPWEARSAPVWLPVTELTGSGIDPGPLPVAPSRPRVSVGLTRLPRAVRAVLRPWVHGVRRTLPQRRRPARFSAPVLRSWREQNAIEPLIPFPRPAVETWYEDGDAPQSSRVEDEISAYRHLAASLPDGVDHLFVAPWLRTGGGDTVLRQYIAAVRRLRPHARIAVLTTEPVESTVTVSDERTTFLELRPFLLAGVERDAMVEWIVPQLIAQWRVATVHAFNSTVLFDVVERYGEQLRATTRLFLSTFAFDRDAEGERTSVLFLRRPGFLDPVDAVLVDSEHFRDAAVRELGYEESAFVLQRTVPAAVDEWPRRRAEDGARLRVFWAGRFDIPKRIDLLARVVAETRRRGLPVEFHFYGVEVMGDPTLADSLERLRVSGAIRHPPFREFTDLRDERFDVFLMTSEWEGVPLTLIDAAAAGLSIVAPLVGGVGEVLDASTGFPIARFDDVEAYVAALAAIVAGPVDARERARAARTTVLRDHSRARFDDVLERIDYLVPLNDE